MTDAAADSTLFGDASPKGLATRLLGEIADPRHLPVWPSTEEYADRLAVGLAALTHARGPEVVRAMLHAPRGTPLRWEERLRHLAR